MYVIRELNLLKGKRLNKEGINSWSGGRGDKVCAEDNLKIRKEALVNEEEEEEEKEEEE